MSRKIKCLLFQYQAWWKVLDKGPVAKTKLSGRAGKLNKEGKKLFIVYPAGPGSFKRGKKVVCLIWQSRKKN